MDQYYISKDIDRITFITASITAFFFASSWLLYGVMLATGQGDNDWRPMCHKALINFCRWHQRNAGDAHGVINEDELRGYHGPEDEEHVEGLGGIERRNKYD